MIDHEMILIELREQGIVSGNRPTPNKHKYLEAFCIMVYQHDKCKSVDHLYNTRDGVTPFTIVCRKCHPQGPAPIDKDVFMRHKMMLMNYQPKFNPPVGMRIFIGDADKPKVKEQTI